MPKQFSITPQLKQRRNQRITRAHPAFAIFLGSSYSLPSSWFHKVGQTISNHMKTMIPSSIIRSTSLLLSSVLKSMTTMGIFVLCLLKGDSTSQVGMSNSTSAADRPADPHSCPYSCCERAHLQQLLHLYQTDAIDDASLPPGFLIDGVDVPLFLPDPCFW